MSPSPGGEGIEKLLPLAKGGREEFEVIFHVNEP